MAIRFENVAVVLVPRSDKALATIDFQIQQSIGYLRADGSGPFRRRSTHLTNNLHHDHQQVLVLQYFKQRYTFGGNKVYDFCLPGTEASGEFFQIRPDARRQRCMIHFYDRQTLFEGSNYLPGAIQELTHDAIISVHGYSYSCKCVQMSGASMSSSVTSTAIRSVQSSTTRGAGHMAEHPNPSVHGMHENWPCACLEKEPYFESYRREQHLGAGGQGEVWRYTCPRCERKYAAKIIRWHRDVGHFTDEITSDNLLIQRESLFPQDLRHENIVSILKVFFYPEGVAIMMHYYDKGDLSTLLENEDLSAADSASIILQLCNGLRYLESQKGMHRDIKPSNVLIRSRQPGEPLEVLLTDLGYVKFATTANTIFASGKWTAPEIRCGHGKSYSRAVDIWSLGYLLFTLLGGAYEDVLYCTQSIFDAHLGKMLREEIEVAQHSAEKERAKLFRTAQRMLSYLPEDRPTLADLWRDLAGYVEAGDKQMDKPEPEGDVAISDTLENQASTLSQRSAYPHPAPHRQQTEAIMVPTIHQPQRPEAASRRQKAAQAPGLVRVMKRRAPDPQTTLQCLTFMGRASFARPQQKKS